MSAIWFNHTCYFRFSTGAIVARLITIGDSVSQGFMSGGAARTDLAYSTLIAKAMSLKNYRYPEWHLGGMPINFEVFLRRLSRYYGDDIWGFEWISVINRIASFLDQVEDYYERGKGDFRSPDLRGYDNYHNLSAFGFTVSDAWQVTPSLCLKEIQPNGAYQPQDNRFGLPDNAFYRSAIRVLNPGGEKTYAQNQDHSQLDWLQFHVDSEEKGVENLILWLGANNALGTVVNLQIKKTNVDLKEFQGYDHHQRSRFNLWNTDHFCQDYCFLLDRVTDIMSSKEHTQRQPDWKVFIGTIPAVTVAPLIKGFGKEIPTKDPFGVLSTPARYCENYTYVFLEKSGKAQDKLVLDYNQVVEIDTQIAAYNEVIRNQITSCNKKLGQNKFFEVDVNGALLQAAYKRNFGYPTYRFPSGYDAAGIQTSTKFYRVKNGVKSAGGIFSLDGIHPSGIGQGLIAHEFITAMQNAGVGAVGSLNWQSIKDTDTLYSNPLGLVEEIFQHPKLFRFIVNRLRSTPKEVDSDDD